ncbi:MAG TPA: hypothetical protein VGE72_26535 [Azospirillum sp.]
MQVFVSDNHHRRLDRRVDRIQDKLPDPIAKALGRIRAPSATWVRFPVGLLLVLGGVFSFLPVLGVWMLPLGLVLLAYDIPLLKAPIGRTLVWAERRWREWKRRRRTSA